jgi:DNA-binding HxlR family transcriptional regulator
MSNSDKKSTIRRRAPVSKDQCPMAMAAEILGDKWTLLILREAFYGVQRYDDMRLDTFAPRSMLTDRLNKLVNNGIMKRQPYQEDGDRVRNSYVLTKKGASLAHVLMAMSFWGEEFILGHKAPVELIDRTSGHALSVEFVDEAGNVVAKKAAVLRQRKNR